MVLHKTWSKTDRGAALSESNCKSNHINVITSSYNELCWYPFLYPNYVSYIEDILILNPFTFLPLFNNGIADYTIKSERGSISRLLLAQSICKSNGRNVLTSSYNELFKWQN